MRAVGKDIVELFGYSPDDLSQAAKDAWKSKKCPFAGGKCTKTSNGKVKIIYGTCSVSNGASKAEGSEVIICPKRLYATQHAIFDHVLASAWPKQSKNLVTCGTGAELKAKALKATNPVVGFGQNSGQEVSIKSNGRMSMDWVLQAYARNGSALKAQEFIGLEIQSIDTTTNYRKNWAAYKALKEGKAVKEIPASSHGLNWTNVHKRLIPQIIRKGNIYSHSDRCIGFFFILPDVVYKKFEEVIGDVPVANGPSRDNLSVITFKLGQKVAPGLHRQLELVRQVHYPLGDVAAAFIANTSKNAPLELDEKLSNLLS